MLDRFRCGRAFIKRRWRILLVVIGIIAALPVAYGLWSLVVWQMNEGHKDALTLYAQIIAGLVLVYGVSLTYKRVTAAEDAVRVAEKNVAMRSRA